MERVPGLPFPVASRHFRSNDFGSLRMGSVLSTTYYCRSGPSQRDYLRTQVAAVAVVLAAAAAAAAAFAPVS